MAENEDRAFRPNLIGIWVLYRTQSRVKLILNFTHSEADRTIHIISLTRSSNFCCDHCSAGFTQNKIQFPSFTVISKVSAILAAEQRRRKEGKVANHIMAFWVITLSKIISLFRLLGVTRSLHPQVTKLGSGGCWSDLEEEMCQLHRKHCPPKRRNELIISQGMITQNTIIRVTPTMKA